VPAVAGQVGKAADAPVLADEAKASRLEIVEVRVDRGPAPAVGAQSERAAVAAPDAEPVVLLAAVGQPPQVRSIGTDEVDLLVHSSAGRKREGEVVAGG
jgi:hypothetical protein